jgi:hypothetical protein
MPSESEVKGPYEVIRDWDGAPISQPHLLTGPKFEMCYKDAIEAELEAERLNLVFEAGRFSASGQGQEERDYTPEEALAEARRRWPNIGPFVIYNSTYSNPTVPNYWVGFREYATAYMPHQWGGNSFRAAFAAAAEKEGGK